MTVIDELLVYLDDGTVRLLEECATALPGRTKQTLSSTLGRLTGKGWVTTTRDRTRGVNTYIITQSGSDTVTRTLAHLKIADDQQWDERWFFVLFNIPERHRKHRDVLRNRLSAVGCGRIQNSLWVTARNIQFELSDLLEDERIARAVTIVKPVLTPADAQALAAAFEWDWEQPNVLYQQFIENAQLYLKRKEHSVLGAKLLVYNYAKLLQRDPKFPTFLEPKEYLRSKAHAQYERIRPYCYEN
ncbi:hypothetical protein HY524_01780 [Candidatus Berkelbacteria bacterium]|nr:hypothetical protein [Candidatus Berkelbacteria bacterium]